MIERKHFQNLTRYLSVNETTLNRQYIQNFSEDTADAEHLPCIFIQNVVQCSNTSSILMNSVTR